MANPATCWSMTAAAGDTDGNGEVADPEVAVDVNGDGAMDGEDITAARVNAMLVVVSHNTALTEGGKGFGPCLLFFCVIVGQDEEKGGMR